ncbi:MAG TPA: hypothetical protein VLT63_00030 [Candidatus Acidoferrum sp.]|nr:hypothetical protein [Candidatus Acidoferrum sp.]
MTEELQIPLEFIEENQKLDQTRPNPKKGGPYDKHHRQKRRNEVYRLHFENGYPARRIADLMKVNRHTIDGDVNYWYSQLSKEWNSYNFSSWLMKQNNRLESQRTRLLEQLVTAENAQDRLGIEKLILEIDGKIILTAIKAYTAQDNILELAVGVMNNWAKENNLEASFIRSRDLTKATHKTREKIEKLIKEDMRNRTARF